MIGRSTDTALLSLNNQILQGLVQKEIILVIIEGAGLEYNPGKKFEASQAHNWR